MRIGLSRCMEEAPGLGVFRLEGLRPSWQLMRRLLDLTVGEGLKEGLRFAATLDRRSRGEGFLTYLGLRPRRVFEIFQGDRDRLSELERLVGELSEFDLPSSPFPFCGGLFGAVAYDAVCLWERMPHLREGEFKALRDLPLICFGLFEDLVVFDHLREELFLVELDRGSGRGDFDRLGFLIERAQLACECPRELEGDRGDTVDLEVLGLTGKERFVEMVELAKDHIASGDAFQLVISQDMWIKSNVKPTDLYGALVEMKASPSVFLVSTPRFSIVCASPEVLVEKRGRTLVSRPLAGTRRRGRTPEEDARLETELCSDEKELAEHVMLVDLARNDLGRICLPGSVRVRELLQVERYPRVMHLASQVEGEMLPHVGPLEALRATFPAGTVSGAPKVRAMELINQIEGRPRGFYGGSIGYLSFCGDMSMWINIRSTTFLGRIAVISSGAGVVFDSDPEREYAETIHKASSILRPMRSCLAVRR